MIIIIIVKEKRHEKRGGITQASVVSLIWGRGGMGLVKDWGEYVLGGITRFPGLARTVLYCARPGGGDIVRGKYWYSSIVSGRIFVLRWGRRGGCWYQMSKTVHGKFFH